MHYCWPFATHHWWGAFGNDKHSHAHTRTERNTHSETVENLLAETMEGHAKDVSLHKETFRYIDRNRWGKWGMHQVGVIYHAHLHTLTHTNAYTLRTLPASKSASLTTGIISLQQMVTVPLKNIFDYYFFLPLLFFSFSIITAIFITRSDDGTARRVKITPRHRQAFNT